MSANQIEQIKAQKIFSSAENPIREWIAKYLDTPVVDLFGLGMINTEPIIFQMKDNYLELKLEVVNSEYKHQLGEFIQNKEVQNAVQFLAYAANVVFMSSVKTLDKPLHRNGILVSDILLVWDTIDLIYIPTYSPPLMREYQLCALRYKEHNDHAAYNRMRELEPLIPVEEIKQKNKMLAEFPRISIASRILNGNDLPIEMYMKHLKPVSDIKYDEPKN